MKVCGFTIVRNAVRFDYPVTEAILSVLPLCDEFIVACGDSDDNSRALIENLNNPKISIIDSVWDMSLRTGGKLLAVETNKALDRLPPADWYIYIQADEIMHESYHDHVHNNMLKWKDAPEVEGLLFDYRHFYGSYRYLGDARRWYRHEVRIIRPHPGTRSWGDAMGFRKNEKKLRVKPSGGIIHHYGWVKPPEAQQAKQESFHKMWHDDAWVARHVPKRQQFDYGDVDSLAEFTGTHPTVMAERIAGENWNFTWDPGQRRLSFKEHLLRHIEKLSGWRPGEYKNYKLI